MDDSWISHWESRGLQRLAHLKLSSRPTTLGLSQASGTSASPWSPLISMFIFLLQMRLSSCFNLQNHWALDSKFTDLIWPWASHSRLTVTVTRCCRKPIGPVDKECLLPWPCFCCRDVVKSSAVSTATAWVARSLWDYPVSIDVCLNTILISLSF